MMQRTEFGQDIPRSGGNFIRVKNANDKVTFRLAQPPVHTGKHFLKNADDTWNVVDCPRINSNEECEYCEEYFELMKLAKDAEAAEDKAGAADLKEQARKGGKQVSIQFFYPVLNRDTESFGILQTTYGVKKEIDAKHNNGVKVLERDMTLLNTGKPAAARYALDVVDSADTRELSDKEKEEYEKAKNFDMMSINSGGNSGQEGEEITFDEEAAKAVDEVFEPEDPNK